MNPAGQQESFRRKAFLSTFYPETVSKLLFSVQKKYPFRVKKKKKIKYGIKHCTQSSHPSGPPRSRTICGFSLNFVALTF